MRISASELTQVQATITEVNETLGAVGYIVQASIEIQLENKNLVLWYDDTDEGEWSVEFIEHPETVIEDEGVETPIENAFEDVPSNETESTTVMVRPVEIPASPAQPAPYA